MSYSFFLNRVPPEVGYQEIIKFIDPRLLNIKFRILNDIEWDYPKFQRFSYVNKDDNYKIAHDIESNPISKTIHVYNKHGEIDIYDVYLCSKNKNNVSKYYIAYVITEFETPHCDCRSGQCENCYEEVGYMYITYEYASDDLASSIFKYLDICDDRNYDY